MSLDSWIVLWKTMFVSGVGLFTALSVVVTIGGARDIARLLRDLRARQADEQSRLIIDHVLENHYPRCRIRLAQCGAQTRVPPWLPHRRRWRKMA